MARFTKAELDSYIGTTIPDLVGPGLKLLFVGINPGLWTAATRTPFSRSTNRFYPALVEAGILPSLPDYVNGFDDAYRAEFISYGLGISNLVARATANEDGLTPAELREGGDRLRENVALWKPRVVAILGIGAYKKAFDPKAERGRQPGLFADAELWVLPNPSARAPGSAVALAREYAEPARAAGVLG